MNILSKSLPLILMTGLFLQVAPAQEKAAAPKAPPTPSEVLLHAWNSVGDRLIAMAEDFPEDKYDFKPNPAQRSFAEQLLHAASDNYSLIDPVKGQKPPADEPKRADFKTKAEVVDYVKKSFAAGADLIKQKSDAGLSDLYVNPYAGRQWRFSDGAWGMLEHSGEHYGQLVVYYRVLGLVPPDSRPKK